MEIKGQSGTAELTADELIFSFTKVASALRRSSETRVPLSSVTAIEFTPGSVVRFATLRIRAMGLATGDDPKFDKGTFVFGLRDAGSEFASALRAATGLSSSDISAEIAQRTAENKAEKREIRAEAADQKTTAARRAPSGAFGDYKLKNGYMSKGSKKWPLDGAQAGIDGVDASSVSGKRVAGGAIAGSLLMPGVGTAAGAVIGAAAKKNSSKRFLTVQTTAGTVVIEFALKDEGNARAFAAKINDASY